MSIRARHQTTHVLVATIAAVFICQGCTMNQPASGSNNNGSNGNTNSNANSNANEAPEGVEIAVLEIEQNFFPASQFVCVEAEPEQEPSESCPDGAGCDDFHWHGRVRAIQATFVTGDIVEDFDFNDINDVAEIIAEDPNPCRCGFGKVDELPIRTIRVSEATLEGYRAIVGPNVETTATCP